MLIIIELEENTSVSKNEKTKTNQDNGRRRKTEE